MAAAAKADTQISALGLLCNQRQHVDAAGRAQHRDDLCEAFPKSTWVARRVLKVAVGLATIAGLRSWSNVAGY